MQKAKVLLIDIETVPHKVYTWGKYDQNVIAFIEYSSLLSVAWKWHGEKKVYSSWTTHLFTSLREPWKDTSVWPFQ